MAQQVKKTSISKSVKSPQLKNPKVKKSDFDKALRAMTKPRLRKK